MLRVWIRLSQSLSSWQEEESLAEGHRRKAEIGISAFGTNTFFYRFALVVNFLFKVVDLFPQFLHLFAELTDHLKQFGIDI